MDRTKVADLFDRIAGRARNGYLQANRQLDPGEQWSNFQNEVFITSRQNDVADIEDWCKQLRAELEGAA